MTEKITVPMSKADLLDKLARIMRDRAYPEFGLAPPPLWANDAAQTILTLFEDLTKLTLASPAPDPGAGPDDGASRIAAERRRQIGVEGWSQDHDSAHTRGQLAIAAASYALPPDHLIRRPASGQMPPPFWPWEVRWWKPVYNGADPRSARIRELEKAGALVAAEIDRLLALAPSAEPPETET